MVPQLPGVTISCGDQGQQHITVCTGEAAYAPTSESDSDMLDRPEW